MSFLNGFELESSLVKLSSAGLFFALIGAPTAAFALEWVPTGEGSYLQGKRDVTGLEYVERSTVSSTNNSVTFWVLIDWKNGGSEDPRQTLTLKTVDCSDQTISTIRGMVAYVNGNVSQIGRSAPYKVNGSLLQRSCPASVASARGFASISVGDIALVTALSTMVPTTPAAGAPNLASGTVWRHVGTMQSSSGQGTYWEWDVEKSVVSADGTEFTATMKGTNVETKAERFGEYVVRCGSPSFRNTNTPNDWRLVAEGEAIYEVWQSGCSNGRAVAVSERYERLAGKGVRNTASASGSTQGGAKDDDEAERQAATQRQLLMLQQLQAMQRGSAAPTQQSMANSNTPAVASRAEQKQPYRLASECLRYENDGSGSLEHKLRNACNFTVFLNTCWVGLTDNRAFACERQHFGGDQVAPGKVSLLTPAPRSAKAFWVACESPGSPRNPRWTGTSITFEGCGSR